MKSTADRTKFYRDLAKLARSLKPYSPNQGGEALRVFRERIMADPEHLRRTLLGANVLRVRRLNTLQRAALDVLGHNPDLMGPLGERRYEPSHTQVIAYLIDPSRGFALAVELLHAFLELVGVDEEELRRLRLDEAKVRPEHFLKSGRVDICLQVPGADEKQAIIFVEVKVDAEEGQQQLERYRNELLAVPGACSRHLVYLTLRSQLKSRTLTEVHPIEFKQLLLAWLPIVAQRGRDWTAGFAAAYLKTLSILTGSASEGSFDDWSFARQRSALAVVEAIREV